MNEENELIDRYGTIREIETYKASLAELFPVSDEMSPWLMRLAILRDDLRFEVEGLGLKEDATNRDAWRCQYFLRKITITLLEAENILNFDLTTALKRRAEDFDPRIVQALREQAKTIGTHRPALEVVRNQVGGHVRPRAQREPEDPLHKHSEWPAVVTLDMKTGRYTDLHEITSTSLLFAWSHVESTIESFDAAHETYQEVIFACVRAVIHSIDIVLWVFWRNRGLRPID